MKVLKRAGRLLNLAVNSISYLTAALSGITIISMAILVFYGVIRRYVFSSPESFSYEYTTYLLVCCMLLSIIHVQKSGQHVKVDIILNQFPQSAQLFIMNVISPVLGCIFSSVFLWASWKQAIKSLVIHKTSTSGTPIYIVQMVLPVTAVLLGIICISQILIYFVSFKKPELKRDVNSGNG